MADISNELKQIFSTTLKEIKMVKKQYLLDPETARQLMTVFPDFEEKLSLNVTLIEVVYEGELKSHLTLEGTEPLIELFEKFLRETLPDWEEFFKEKKEVIDGQQT